MTNVFIANIDETNVFEKGRLDEMFSLLDETGHQRFAPIRAQDFYPDLGIFTSWYVKVMIWAMTEILLFGIFHDTIILNCSRVKNMRSNI
ncbi:unnamed protein product [Pseudo-nitzschia multistriata]|uniref:Uncharacterized protein n=1 Tax=Pseudo-nitzschia multistriata TaxID=183589 RepID=A0A448YY22_9STRA|nr:unnamed protein product [Pseudo-nitzschia multistriata]